MTKQGIQTGFTRRGFLRENAMGLGIVALASLLEDEKLLGVPRNVKLEPQKFDLTAKQPHFEPKAKAMISLFQHGGPSHMDLFDPKPELTRLDGKTYDGDVGFSFIKRATKVLKGTPFNFSKHGESLSVTENEENYKPGDIITWNLMGSSPWHIGIVVDEVSSKTNNPLIVHNIGRGPVIDDVIFKYPIRGHYRFPK